MAFRKKVKCSNVVSAFYGGFHERKMKPYGDGSGVQKQELSDVSVYEVSESALPIVSLSVVQQSGKYIQGNVDFSPTDPTYSNDVMASVANYANQFEKSETENKE